MQRVAHTGLSFSGDQVLDQSQPHCLARMLCRISQLVYFIFPLHCFLNIFSTILA